MDGFNPSELSDEDLMAQAMGDEDDTDVEEVADGAEATGGSDDDGQESEQQHQQQNWNPDGPGDLREALRQEREARRQYEAQVAQYQQQLAQYQLYQQQLAQQQQPQRFEPPNAWEDPEGYTQYQIQQALAPIQQQLQGAAGYIQQLEYERELSTFGQQFPDAPSVIKQIDAQIPEMRDLPIEAKYYLWRGAQMTDPAAQQAAIENQAKQMAAQMASKQLTNKNIPSSLAHVGQSTVVSPEPLPVNKLSDADLRKRARGE